VRQRARSLRRRGCGSQTGALVWICEPAAALVSAAP